jgi:large conductance mechanosensitive channel
VPDNNPSLLQEFKAFVLRGNIVELAVAFVIAAAFKDVVTALVGDMIMPIVSIPGKTNFGALKFNVRHSVFAYGHFINMLVAFVILAAAVFFFVVKPVDHLMARLGLQKDPEAPTKVCPECLTLIPVEARRCAACTSPQPA